MDNSLILDINNLGKSFGSGRSRVDAVKEINLQVPKGQLVLIMGPSGSGKTTLLSMLGGLLKPSQGEITIDGENITAMDEDRLPDIRARKVGFIFQAFNLLEALTVRENMLFPARLFPDKMAQAEKRADNLIDRLGLQERQNTLPATLSGGEKQRTAIARALINEPPLILADEPTGNLDSQSGQEVMMVLHDIARDEQRSVIIVSHDPRIEVVADRILWLQDGRLRDRNAEDIQTLTCPVCHMQVDPQRVVYTLKYHKHDYSFCSRRCYERFQESPEKYQDRTKAGL